MIRRKYMTEFGLHIIQTKALLIYPSDLKNHEFESSDNFHIYMVHKVPKITIKPESISTDVNKITLILELADKERKDEKRINFGLDNNFDHTTLEAITEYPYNKLLLYKKMKWIWKLDR